MADLVEHSELIKTMIKTAEEAGDLLLDYFYRPREELNVTQKALGDFVTVADTASEAKIKSLLEKAYPQYNYLMEESGATQRGSDKKRGRWIVDPLDGTSNFLKGLKTWSLSIALEVEGEVVAGLIYAPCLKELFWAEKGRGAWMQDRAQNIPVSDQKISVASAATIGKGLMAVYPQDKYVGSTDDLLKETGSDIRTLGSACLDLAYVAAGRYDAFIKEAKFGPWDLAAGSLLVKEAGGAITDTKGQHQKCIYGDNILAANPALHTHILQELQSSGKIFKQKPEKEGLLIDYISDIHAEFWNGTQYDYAQHKKNDIVIVNGDLRTDTKASIEELKKIAAVYKTVLFVDGNHEYRTTKTNKDGKTEYPYNFDFDAVKKTLREGIAQIPNVTWLADKPFVKDGVAIIGRNGHWDYKMINGYSEDQALKEGYTYLTGSFAQAATFPKLARQDYYGLRDELYRFSNDPSIHTVVVVTHTVPRIELLNWPEKVTLAKQAQMGSRLMRDLLQHDLNKKVKHWLFGHQHASKEQKIHGVTYHENPRGFHYDGDKDYKPSVFKF